MINGNFKVNKKSFAQWFNEDFRKDISLWEHTLIVENFEKVINKIYELTQRDALSLNEFVGLFCFIYNETGGKFQSIRENGDEAYFNSKGYTTKDSGRGLIQLTHDYQYKYFFKNYSWVYDYDKLTSKELDALFLKPEIYYLSAYAYLNDTNFAGKYWGLLNDGKFGDYGATIACGNPNSSCPAYRPKFENRCNSLLKSLKENEISTDSSLTSYVKRNSYRFFTSPKYLALSLGGLALIGFSIFAINKQKKRKSNGKSL